MKSLYRSSSEIIWTKQDENFLRSNLHVSRETMTLLQIYVDLLVEWQNKTNLVSSSTINDVWQRHICDSAQCKIIMPTKKNWVDLGTGAGFPGLVLGILGRKESGFSVKLVESNEKKGAFLRKVVRETAIPAKVYVERIESITGYFKNCEVITARALTSLDRLLGLAAPWLENGVTGLFLKGNSYLEELGKCRGIWEFDLINHVSCIEKNSVLLEIGNLKRSKFKKLC